jgi:hypothetical protein
MSAREISVHSLAASAVVIAGALLAACHTAPAGSGPNSPSGGVGGVGGGEAGANAMAHQISTLAAGPGTVVVRLSPNQPIAILAGPFEVRTINPGGNLSMAIAPDRRCADPSLPWFSYSGGGVAVGAGQVLCVRSSSASAVTHGFSGVSAGAPPPLL